MNICILNREYPPHGLMVGPAIFYQTLARLMAGRGHSVHVVCQGDGTEGRRQDGDVTVHEVGRRTARGSALARIDYAIRARLALRRLIRDEGIEVIDTQFYPAEGLLYGFRKGRAALALETHAWGEMMMYHGLWLNTLLRVETVLEHLTARRADVVIAPSEAAYRHITGRVRVPAERVPLLPVTSTVDTTAFRPVESDVRREMGIAPEERLVLCVGRLEARKGAKTLCDAMPLIHADEPTARFVLVGQDTRTAPGGGSFRDFIIAETKRAGIAGRVQFKENIPHDELVALYSAADVFVYPSLVENNGAPPLQAMACCCPVVATKTGVSVDLAAGGAGIAVIPPDDPQALAAEALRLLRLSPDERATAGESNRRAIEERFSFEVTVDRLLGAYEQAIELRRAQKGGAR